MYIYVDTHTHTHTHTHTQTQTIMDPKCRKVTYIIILSFRDCLVSFKENVKHLNLCRTTFLNSI